MSVGYLIALLSKYYYQENQSSLELIQTVKKELFAFNIEYYQEYLYIARIKKMCNALTNNEISPALRERDYIVVFREDLDRIKDIESIEEQKLLFTIMIYAKLAECNGWTNRKDIRGFNEMFKASDIKGSLSTRYSRLHSLIEAERVQIARNNTSLNLKCPIVEDGKDVAHVNSFEHLGNFYVGHFVEGYRMCQNEGCENAIRIRSKVGRPQVYCRECAKEISAIKKKSWREKRG